jgi:hypothetical protein
MSVLWRDLNSNGDYKEVLLCVFEYVCRVPLLLLSELVRLHKSSFQVEVTEMAYTYFEFVYLQFYVNFQDGRNFSAFQRLVITIIDTDC